MAAAGKLHSLQKAAMERPWAQGPGFLASPSVNEGEGEKTLETCGDLLQAFQEEIWICFRISGHFLSKLMKASD